MKSLCCWFGLAVLVLVGAAACSGSTDVVSAESGTATSSVTPSSATGEAGQDEVKSLEDYLGVAANFVRGGGGGGAGGLAGTDQDLVLEEQRLIEQEIQVCMQAQGFTYVPEEVGDSLRFFLQSQNEGASPADYAATEGFGISTRFDAILEDELDLSEAASPNEQHLATLSEGEADAWQFALRGSPPERNEAGQLVDPETGEVIQGAGRGRATGGCTLEAQVNVRGDFNALGELGDEFAELTDRIESDPRVAEIRREWVDCMRVEGFDYTDEAEARADVNSRVRPLLFSFFSSQDGDQTQQGPGQGGRGLGGGNALQAIAGMQLTAEQDAELEALQDLERSIAVASLSCQGDTAAEVEEITARYESEFVEANRAALEAFDS